ncbi:hypothetical protein SAMN04244573_03193 [Azotobacter beijerinckii]|uniref:Uncharacterized protein n=1 Tax=Azotobacter beijerinckii TaxID=170623 RepID=A0A1H9MNA0_9GAMM|nr:hypothetical protein [Azotobacter beijerinckii]SER24937.1 hypothetical protein SAMN04244573_03193 [Azotobacter beijerinckii]
MQLHEAHEVKEVYSPQEANKAIQGGEGWKLIAVTSVTNPKMGFGEQWNQKPT